jgi:glycosyltransferase involved in cell wall biosynthesis
MRLLVCAAEAPLPPLGGLRHPLRQLLLRLRDYHDVALVAYIWPNQERQELDGIECTYFPVPAKRLPLRAGDFMRAVAQGKPLRAVELHQPMYACVSEAVSRQDFDVAHLAGLPLATLAPAVRAIPSAMVVLDAYHLNAAAEADAASPLLRPLKRLESYNTMRFERRRLRHFDRVVTVTGNDAAALTRLDPDIRPAVIPNGVDTEHFRRGDGPHSKHLLVFVGTMSWAPNIQAATYMARDVLPLIRESYPDVRLAVVGRGAARRRIDELESYSGVSVVGEVADVRPWFQRAHAAVCPMVSGTGMKNKLLEALACGAPSVATSLACQGTALVHEEHLLVADRADEFAAQVGRVFGDDLLRERIATGGRSYVSSSHSWDAVAEQFQELYEAMIRERLSGPAAPLSSELGSRHELRP